MAASAENVSMAMFCDFENVALGVREANYDKFDIHPVLERLLLKGSIVLKKAYCDWERYKGFKAAMHEANFELIEIPHVRQSGKNSADIRMVVDALDLCYTKSHVNTFVIVSGDSDFSPLVSKLRENDKYVIGVGVKHSTSDLLVANCDEFIFYDDLVRERRRDAKSAQNVPRRTPEEDKRRKEESETRKSEAIDLAVATFDALVAERGDGGKIWASMLKSAIKRRRPDFNESHYGFRVFGNLLEEAQQRGIFELGRDEKSGTFVSRASGSLSRGEVPGDLAPDVAANVVQANPLVDTAPPAPESGVSEFAPAGEPKRRGRGRRSAKDSSRNESVAVTTSAPDSAVAVVYPAEREMAVAPPATPELADLRDVSETSVAEAITPEAAPKKPAPRGRRPSKAKASNQKSPGPKAPKATKATDSGDQ